MGDGPFRTGKSPGTHELTFYEDREGGVKTGELWGLATSPERAARTVEALNALDARAEPVADSDLVALLAAADLTWGHEFGDEPSIPAYIRHLARCVTAGRALPYEPSSSDAPHQTAAVEPSVWYGQDLVAEAGLKHVDEETWKRVFDAFDSTEPPVVDSDLRDRWIGYYRGDTHHYVCPLPTVVIRWRRRLDGAS